MMQKRKKMYFVSKKKLYHKKWCEVHSAKLDMEHYVQTKTEVKQNG